MRPLWEHQEEAVKSIRREWSIGHKRTMAAICVGGGKTRVALHVLDMLRQEERLTRAVWLGHRVELVEQPIARAWEDYPELAALMGVVMADKNDADAQIVVATPQTLLSEGRLDKVLAHGGIDYVILDELHHYVSSWGKVLEKIGDVFLLGLTATPRRADNAGMIRIVQSCAFRFPITAGIASGALCQFDAIGYSLPVSFAGVRETGDGWDDEQSGSLLEKENVLEIVLAKWQESCSKRKTLAFTASVSQARESAAYFRAHGIAAEAADGTTPKPERAAILDRYRSGETRVIFNCALFTEGIDLPDTSALLMLKPTRSSLAYSQMLGRVLRAHPSKTSAHVLDFCPLDARDIILAGDVLGEERELTKAKEKADHAGVLLGALRIDAFGQLSTIDPSEVVARLLDYLSKGTIAWSLQKNLAIATLSRDTMMCIALPEFDRIARAEALCSTGDWNGKLDAMLAWVSSTRLIIMRKDECGWWQPSLVGQYADFGEARKAADALIEREDLDIHLARRKSPWRQELPSPRQIDSLVRMGVNIPQGMSKGQASQLISIGIARQHVVRLFETKEREMWK